MDERPRKRWTAPQYRLQEHYEDTWRTYLSGWKWYHVVIVVGIGVMVIWGMWGG